MRQLFFFLFIIVSLSAFSQKKDTTAKDTVVHIVLKQSDFNAFYQWLDNLNENHKTIKAIQALFINNAQLQVVPKKKP